MNLTETTVPNKKVLLREHKRHIARHVASTRYAVPVGGTPTVLGPDLERGGGVPPSQVWMGRVLFPGLDGGGAPQVWMGGGYPL